MLIAIEIAFASARDSRTEVGRKNQIVPKIDLTVSVHITFKRGNEDISRPSIGRCLSVVDDIILVASYGNRITRDRN